ncbi:hypothetical protein HDU87_007293 [Geranomyces variabilis]|uniref:DNA-directed DNA polymerase n=1 Tax=Geranomyces variabilis TaxID=109894 RepID=A0AAD5TF80_9FUNG|nr:hypothetical protein HDU87_007293 [Geranomyces variabilis]
MLTALTPPMAHSSFSTEENSRCVDSLLQPPSSTDAKAGSIARTTSASTHHNEQFVVTERVYTQQYAGIYFTRLNKLRPRTFAAAKERWGSRAAGKAEPPPAVPRVLDVRPGQVCYIVGTVYIEMPLKPSILDEVTKEHWIVAPPPREKYKSDLDQVVLEDESGRVSLTGAILKTTMLVTGIIIAVLGCENAEGKFEVIDICYSAAKPQPPLPSLSEDKYVAFVSGLNIGGGNDGLHHEILVDFLTGELGTPKDQERSASIVRLVVAGNSVEKLKQSDDEKKMHRNRYGAETATFNAEPLRMLDTLLASLCHSLSIDILPGDADPANCSLPQQPLHPALFPTASKYNTLNCVTNPSALDVDGLMVLVTSGQTLDDVFRFVETEDRLEMACCTMTWAHLAPTAPDTLWCHPYKDEDPFVINSRPHIYVVGNQPSYATKLIDDEKYGTTRVVLVPPFATSKTLVLVNLRTLEAVPMVFGTASA